MFCSKCGNEVTSGDFCSKCGNRVGDGASQQQSQQGTAEASAKLDNLYKVARRAKNDGNIDQAFKYYEQISMEDPNGWEPTFYVAYYSAVKEYKADKISSAIGLLGSCLNGVFDFIGEIEGYDKQKNASEDVATDVSDFAEILKKAAWARYDHDFDIANDSNRWGFAKANQMRKQVEDDRDSRLKAIEEIRNLVEQRQKRLGEVALKEQLEQLQKAAEQGDVTAVLGMGLWYFNGQGGAKDFIKAAEWFRKAADQGHGEAQDYLVKAEAAEKERLAKAEIAEKERKEREECESQKKLRSLKNQLKFINISVLVGLIVGLISLALVLFLNTDLLAPIRDILPESDVFILIAIISAAIGFYVPSVWPVLKRTWIIAKAISFFLPSKIFGDDMGCFFKGVATVVAALIFGFAYYCIATFGAPINVIVTIVRFFSIRKKIKNWKSATSA
jgi:TPR repeat protein